MVPGAAEVRASKWCLLALAGALLLSARSAAVSGETPRPTTDQIQRRINDLFLAAHYDSILVLIPGYIQRAEAEHDSVLLGRMLAQRGRVLTMTGRGAQGVHDIDRGLGMAIALRDTVGWMPAVHFKGFYYSTISRYDDALRCFEKRLALAKIVHSPVDEAQARSSIAYVAAMRGDHDHAREQYTRAIMLFRHSKSPWLETTPLIGLGRIEAGAGNETEARHCFQRAWVVAHGAGDRVNEMWATNNLGVMEANGGDRGRAAAYSQRAFDIAREIDYPHGMVIPALNLAKRAEELGEFARAESLLTDARELCRTRGVDEFLNLVDFSLAELRNNEGRYDSAGAIFRRLLADRDRIEPQHRDFAVIGLARSLAHHDSVTQAIGLLTGDFDRPGADVFATAQPEGNLLLSQLYERAGNAPAALHHAQRALEHARKLGWQRMAVSARLRQSVCYRALGRRADAYAALMAGLDSLDVARLEIRDQEWREIYGQETAQDVLNAGRILLEYPDDAPARVREAAFFNTLQRFKTRSLLDRIAEPGQGVEPPATRASLTIDDLRHRVLRPGEVLLEFFVGTTESYLAAVSPDTLRLVTLPGPGSPLAESIDLYHDALASADASLQADFPAERLASIQRAIGEDVLGGVADLIGRATRVLIAPDGFFALIPFGTLMRGDSSQMLMERVDVVQIPSASVLALQRSRPAGARTGIPRIVALESTEDLPGAHSEVRDLAKRYRGVETVRGLSGGPEDLASIAARGEVLHIAAHALVVDGSPWQSGLRLASGPSTADSVAVRGFHLPADTSAILSIADSIRVAREFEPDPFVRAYQIASMSLPAKLTVLAGCETAGGRMTTGEGILGLTSAFMSAGVPVVVSSLWSIDDRATARVMRSFYAHLARRETVATSLRLAQMEMRRTRGYAHPFYWAGFTVVGDGALSVQVERKSPVRAILSLLVVILAVVSLAVWAGRNRRRAGDLHSSENRV